MKVLFLLLLYYNIDNHKYSLNLFLSSGYNYFTNHSDALKFLYPRGFSTPDFEKRAILASTNTITDEWNSMIQNMNPAQSSTLFSSDIVDEVDDPHGIINDMLNSDTLEYWTKPGVPNHKLVLKKGDICFLLRTISKKDHLSKNTRVRIQRITRYRIIISTLDAHPKVHSIPRIRFKVPHVSGFSLSRTQFPLALAYAMTKNKAQGQSLQWSLNDIRSPSFSHGQEYVALSRPVDFDQVAIFCTEDQVYEDSVFITNIVYPELFL